VPVAGWWVVCLWSRAQWPAVRARLLTSRVLVRCDRRYPMMGLPFLLRCLRVSAGKAARGRRLVQA
jgi:hypothetical protein